MPVESGTDYDILSDLAIDILGSFLRSTRDQPYAVIFDHFHEKGMSGYDQLDPVELFKQFRSLLFGFVRQELSRIKKETDPQLDHLKRRIKDILKQPNYNTFFTANNHTEFVCYADNETNKRNSCPPITYGQLLVLVKEAYDLSRNRNEWCHNIFKALNDMTYLQNCLKKHELISAMVNINMKYVEVDGLQSSRFPGTDYQVHEKAIENARKLSLSWLDKNLLKRFVQKDRITKRISQQISMAVDMYLSDMIYSSGVDLLPAYFREVMPESEHARYLKDYKHIFETSIYKTEQYFRDLIKKSINLSYSDYLKNVEKY